MGLLGNTSAPLVTSAQDYLAPVVLLKPVFKCTLCLMAPPQMMVNFAKEEFITEESVQQLCPSSNMQTDSTLFLHLINAISRSHSIANLSCQMEILRSLVAANAHGNLPVQPIVHSQATILTTSNFLSTSQLLKSLNFVIQTLCIIDSSLNGKHAQATLRKFINTNWRITQICTGLSSNMPTRNISGTQGSLSAWIQSQPWDLTQGSSTIPSRSFQIRYSDQKFMCLNFISILLKKIAGVLGCVLGL